MNTIDPGVTGRRRFKKQRRPLWPSRTVCEYFADITPRTLHRWKNDPTMGFPQPTTVNHRDYYDADAIEAFALKRRVMLSTRRPPRASLSSRRSPRSSPSPQRRSLRARARSTLPPALTSSR
jgi:hypothetical protein